ncbi:NUDIX hydrolase [Actinophytocola sp. S1-96]|uniref:NUDIX hydrolase n=1 Tax=Actinophytocola gossypii TaxID=2812003 RepID=A0ABT2JAC1_9PSEU|nr:NUDIX hydrolase [Actinophytocola gossypii]
MEAAGAVVWRPDPNDRTGKDVQLAVVHRPRYDDWSLPKGKLEPGEPAWAGAVREVAEETGSLVALGRHLGQVRYRVTRPVRATKVVDYYAARHTGGGFAPNEEVDELRWCSPQDAAELLSYHHDSGIVSSFTALPADLTTLLVVRHAKAGSRDQWDGPDVERPLSENGRRQLPALRALAGLYGADRVYSAPLVRCVDTVAGIADDAGVPVLDEPLLSEEAYQGAEERAVARLRELAAGGGTPVVCSQGGVIPDLLSRVAGDLPMPMRRLESKKGSVWALFFTVDGGARLVAADYVRRP